MQLKFDISKTTIEMVAFITKITKTSQLKVVNISIIT